MKKTILLNFHSKEGEENENMYSDFMGRTSSLRLTGEIPPMKVLKSYLDSGDLVTIDSNTTDPLYLYRENKRKLKFLFSQIKAINQGMMIKLVSRHVDVILSDLDFFTEFIDILSIPITGANLDSFAKFIDTLSIPITDTNLTLIKGLNYISEFDVEGTITLPKFKREDFIGSLSFYNELATTIKVPLILREDPATPFSSSELKIFDEVSNENNLKLYLKDDYFSELYLLTDKVYMGDELFFSPNKIVEYSNSHNVAIFGSLARELLTPTTSGGFDSNSDINLIIGHKVTLEEFIKEFHNFNFVTATFEGCNGKRVSYFLGDSLMSENVIQIVYLGANNKESHKTEVFDDSFIKRFILSLDHDIDQLYYLNGDITIVSEVHNKYSMSSAIRNKIFKPVEKKSNSILNIKHGEETLKRYRKKMLDKGWILLRERKSLTRKLKEEVIDLIEHNPEAMFHVIQGLLEDYKCSRDCKYCDSTDVCALAFRANYLKNKLREENNEST